MRPSQATIHEAIRGSANGSCRRPIWRYNERVNVFWFFFSKKKQKLFLVFVGSLAVSPPALCLAGPLGQAIQHPGRRAGVGDAGRPGHGQGAQPGIVRRAFP